MTTQVAEIRQLAVEKNMAAAVAAEKIESMSVRIESLETQAAECSAKKVEAEKVAAVAEQRSADMAEQLAETRKALSEAKKESKALFSNFSKEIQELREANKALKIKNAGLVAIAEATIKKERPVDPEKNQPSDLTYLYQII